MSRARLLRNYASCLVAADSKDSKALERQSALAAPLSRLTRLHSRFAAWIATRDVEVFITASETCEAHAYFLRRLRDNADRLLTAPEEELLAALYDSTAGAWGRLYGRYTLSLIHISTHKDDPRQGRVPL